MDEVLDGAPDGGLDEHLAGCPACAEQWSQLTRLERRLRAPSVVDPPAGFQRQTMARLVQAEGPAWIEDSWLRGLLSAATLVVGLLLASIGMLAVGQALGRPAELTAWWSLAGAGYDVATGLAAMLSPVQAGWLFWPLAGALALALAVIWFGVLVLPRRFGRLRRPS
jgi:anti-sigma factor RsiW